MWNNLRIISELRRELIKKKKSSVNKNAKVEQEKSLADIDPEVLAHA